MKKPLIGISMGDPFGIGPEVCAKAVSNQKILNICNPVILGDASVIKDAINMIGLTNPIHKINSMSNANFNGSNINVYAINYTNIEDLTYGIVSAEAGDTAFHAIKKNIELAKDGIVDATVTAPIHKESLNLAGYNYAGHTEIYAEFTNAEQVAMLLVDGDFRVIHVSTHVSLRKACDMVKKERVVHVIRLLDEACKQFGIEKPSIAVCGLNPHASDGGLFGKEEKEEIIPAIQEATEKGIKAEGPFAADTLFSKVVGGLYDGCVAMYHDQGHVPFKVKGFVWDREEKSWGKIHGVNITLGIPIIRVSVDHGTAFDIAGKGIANPESMIHAIEYAVRMANNNGRSNG